MAVQEQTPLREYTANGVTTSFALGFDCEETNHLIVTIDDIEVLPTDWHLSGSNVIFWNAPSNGKLIKLQRNTPFNRLADYQSYNNSFRPPAINKEFDRIWWKLQELGVADWILHNRIDALKAYVDQHDSELQQNIDNLKIYVDDKDDELRAYLLAEIQKQGVALDQLDEYYNYLMQRLAQIAIDKGWEASFVVSAGGDNQQEINDRGGSYWREKPLGYDINSRVMLENGDIVKSTVPNNTVDPNVDMTGWYNESQAINSIIEYDVEKWALPINVPIGDGIYRNVKDLYTVGSDCYRFSSRSELESWLGFNLSTLINVVEEAPIDTVIIQKAINELSQKYISSGEPSKLRFKLGGIYYTTGLNLKCGVNYIGQETILKKRPALNITNEGALKWWRVAVADPLSFNTAEKCAHRCVIDGFTFDGNMSNMNWTYNTYNQEQGSSLLLQGATGNGGGSADVRGKFLVRNLNFINSVSDGLHIVQNSDVVLDGGLTAKDCFRGGLVMTGGNSIVIGGGMVSNNARFDMEVDSGGYGGSFYTYRNIENYFQDIAGKSGDFVGGADIESTSGSEVELINFHVHSHPTNITTATTSSNKGKKLKIKSSTLTWGVGSGSANRIMNPIGGNIFEDVKHRLDSNGYMYVVTDFSGYVTSDDWAFNGGSFEYVGESGSIANKLIEIGSQSSTANGFLVLKDLDTTKAPTPYLVSHPIGGKTEFNNVKHASTTAFLTKGSNASYPSLAKFSKLNESSPPIEFVKVTYSPVSADGVIFTSDVKMPNSLNIQTNNNLGAATRSNRVVYGDTPPSNTTPSIIGDTYILNSKVTGKPYEWIATTTSVANSIYRAKSWIFGSFTTAELPVLTPFDAGCQNFDTTLNKIVTWNGTSWV